MSVNRRNPSPFPRGEKHPNAKLTSEQVREMRSLNWERGICINCLSKIFGVNYRTVWKVVNMVTWKNV